MAREGVPVLFDEGVLRQLCDLDVSSALCSPLQPCGRGESWDVQCGPRLIEPLFRAEPAVCDAAVGQSDKAVARLVQGTFPSLFALLLLVKL